MPREIVAVGKDSRIVVAWGWELIDGRPTAALDIESTDGKPSTGMYLDWGDLERLNRAVRRAMKHHRKALAPSSD